jgi:NCAIR mutase (PurE)-related protein
LYPFNIRLSEDRIEIGTRFFGLKPLNWEDIDRIERSGRNKVILCHAKTEEKETFALSLFTNNRTIEIISYIDNIMKRKRG